jgi:hypothetical protein
VQISPVPPFAWSNPAAANQQAASELRTNATNASGSSGAAKPSIGDVERTSETMDRDADGQYDGSAPQRESSSEEQEPEDLLRQEPPNLLELPADEQQGELDLMG